MLFDCAGLTVEPNNILDELAQQAAIEALRNSSMVVFCIDISKSDLAEDIAVRMLIKQEALIAVATKSDLLSENVLVNRLAELNKLFAADFLVTSAETGTGIEQLKGVIDGRIIELTTGSARRNTSCELRATRHEVALTARHRQAVTEAIENTNEAVNELKAGSDEIAAMLLRAAYQAVSNIEQHIDEQILERIFSRFCIGK